jgi:hypothetical protein
MNHMPNDLKDFDFVWSSCSIEHLRSIEAGTLFMETGCLRPGGVAVHTTEYNVSSNEDTLMAGSAVIFRRRDLVAMAEILALRGHAVASRESHGRYDRAPGED